MAVVRDLLIQFGAKLDDGSLKKADRKVKGFADRTSKTISNAFGAAFLVGLGIGVKKITEMASDVEENLNVINASFGNSAQSVQNWAESFGNAAGRNKYALEETAATLGAILNPLMERNADAAAEMSTGLAQLSVDLGSFFNAADKDVLTALRSGIVGELEPLKRFGIVMTQDALQAFALSQGIRKSIQSMSIAEKTTLRYNFILANTSNAQGDAIKTADGYANSQKALTSKLEELATAIGLKILPSMTKLTNIARKIVTGFLAFTKGTKILEAGLIVLGAVAAKVALGIIVAFAPVLIPLAKMAAAIALVTLVVDDFLTFLDGGDSILGRFIDWIHGPGSATNAVQDLKLAFAAAKKNLGFFFDSVEKGDPILKSLLGLVLGPDSVEEAFYNLVGILAILTTKTQFFFDLLEALPGKIKSAFNILGGAGGKAFDILVSKDNAGGSGALAALTAGTVGQIAGVLGSGTTNNVGQTVNVTVQGNASVETAEKVGKAALGGASRANRNAQAALRQRGQ